MPKLSDLEIRRRLMQDKAIKSDVPMEVPKQNPRFVNKQLSRINAIIARRATFKQAGV